MSDLGDLLGLKIRDGVDAYIAGLTPNPDGTIPFNRTDSFKAMGNAIYDQIPIANGQLLSKAFTPGVVFNIPHTLVNSAGAARDYVGWRCTNGLNIREIPDADQTDKSAGIDLMVQGPEEVEERAVTGSADDTMTFSGLDGDSDVQYSIEGLWRAVGGGPSFLNMKPNGITANQSSTGVSSFNGTGPGVLTRGELVLATAAGVWSSNGVVQFRASFYSNSNGIRRGFQSTMGGGRNSSGQSLNETWGGAWNDGTTLVTSLVIQPSRANDLGVGTRIRLFRAHPALTTAKIYLH